MRKNFYRKYIDNEIDIKLDAGTRQFEEFERKFEKRQDALADFEKRLAEKIARADDDVLRLRLTKIQKQIDLNKITLEYISEYMLLKSEQLLENALSLYAAKRDKIIQESSNRASDFVQQAADIEYHSTHANFENQLYDIEQWKAATIADAAAKESDAIKKNAQQSIERANNLIGETATLEFHAAHSAFENQLYDIEQWKAATIADAAAKESDAFEREMDKIQGRVESAQNRLARLTLLQKDYDLYKARKQYEQDLPTSLADALFSAEINRIKRTSSGKHLDYNQTPRQFYDYSNSSGRAAIDDMYRNLDAKSAPLLKINPKNYAQYKAQQEFEKAISQLVDASIKAVEPFNQQIQTTTGSVTQFDTAIKKATNALRGANNPEPAALDNQAINLQLSPSK